MAYFDYNGKNVYYELHGEGAPLLILNGIMMSSVSWQLFIRSFSHNQLILVDFFDQGKTAKLEGQSYKQDIQVELLVALLEHLHINKVNMVGISYGGEVALQFAVKHQDLLAKLVLFNTAYCTSSWLEDIGRGWIKTAKTYDANAFYKITIPVIYSPSFYNNQIEWMKNREGLLNNVFTKTFLDAMIRLIESAEGFDVSQQANLITCPTLIVGADEDYLTPLYNQKYLHEQIKGSDFVIIPGCGHASMYEKPTLFISIVNGFVNSDTSVKIV